MKLTKSADFAMRIVIYLATDQVQGVTMPILSERLDIPYNNLSKLIQQLSKAEVVRTRQGKNGGVSLLKKAEDISLKTIIDIIDGPTRLSECLNNTHFCSQMGMCKLKGVLGEVQDQIEALLDRKKISDLV